MGEGTFRHARLFSWHTRLTRWCVISALAVAVAATAAAPAFAGEVTIVGHGDQLFATIDEGSFFEMPFTATDATGHSLTWFVNQWMTVVTPTNMVGPGNMVVFRYTPPTNYFTADPSFTNVGYVSFFDSSTGSDSVDIYVTVNPVEDLPVITQGAFYPESTQEDVPKSFTLNATDADGDALTWWVSSEPVNGTIAASSVAPGTALSVDYTPDPEFSGFDPFEITVTDGKGTAVVTVDMNVTFVNDAPLANTDIVGGLEDVLITGDLLVNDFDADSDILRVTSFTSFAGMLAVPGGGFAQQASVLGTVTVHSNGYYEFEPAADSYGDPYFTLTYTVTDETLTDSADLTISIFSAPDDPVIAQGSSLATSTPEGVAKTITLDAFDADGDWLNWVLVGPVVGGTVDFDATVNTNPTLTYTPDPGFFGPESITVTVDDGTGRSDTITIDITVNPSNDMPSFTAGADVNFLEDCDAVSVIGKVQDIDAGFGEAAQALSFDVSCDNPALFLTQPTISSTGVLAFRAKPDVFGTAQVTVTLSDDDTYGAGTVLTTAPQYFDIVIEPLPDAPLAVDDAYSVNEDATLMVPGPGVLFNDTDADGDPITSVIDTYPAHGTLFLFPNGSFLYAPTANYNGPDSFTYHANDGALDSPPVTVDVTVNSVNDVPVITQGSGANHSTAEDTATSFTLSASDLDLDPITWSIEMAPAHGAASVNAAGLVTYTPTTDFFGNDSFKVKAADGKGGVALIDVSMAVSPAAESLAVTYVIPEDSPAILKFFGSVVASVISEPTHDSYFVVATQWIRWIPTPTSPLEPLSNFQYAPAADYFGTDSFTVDLSGSSSTITLNILPVNDAPRDVTLSNTSVSEAATVGSVVGIVSATDPDFTVPTYSLVGGDTSAFALVGNELRTKIAFDYEARSAYTVTLRADDSFGGVTDRSITISVTNFDDAPVVLGETYLVGEETLLDGDVSLNDYDPDSSSVTWMLSEGPAHAASFTFVDGPGTFSYTPQADFIGTDTFTYHVISGGKSADGVVTITVANVNDAPVASVALPGVSEPGMVFEDTMYISDWSVLANDNDVDGDVLSAALVTPPAHGTFLLFPNGYFLYVPAADYSGPDSFTYRAFDGSAYSSQITNEIWVTSANDAPTSVGLSGISVSENSPAGTLVGQLDTTDQDSATFTYAVVDSDDSFAVIGDELVTARELDYESEAGLTVTVRTDDGAGGTFEQGFEIDVIDVDEAPIAQADVLDAVEDTLLTVASAGVLVNDADPEGAPLAAALVDGPQHGTLELSADGGLTYSPDTNYCGDDAFSYQASDGGLDSENTPVTIRVARANDAPVAVSDAYSTDEDVRLVVEAPGLVGNDEDIDDDALVPSVVSTPRFGTVTFGDGGGFEYTPTRGWSGTDSFTYRAFDGAAYSNTVAVTITVRSIDTAMYEIAGADRVLTATKVSQTAFPEGADTVVIATSRNWPDALGGAALAGAVDGPILLTGSAGLSPHVLTEINRLGATNAYVLGGESAVPAGVFTALDAALGGTVERLGGATRYETAQVVAAKAVAIGGSADGVAFLAKGTNFPDALAASPLSAFKKWPIYLAGADGISDSTKAAMLQVGINQVIVLGSDAAIAPAVEDELVALGFDTERISGVDRYATAHSVAAYGVSVGLSWDGLVMATGQNFPDGLSGGVLAAKRGGVMLLNPRDTLHPAVHDAVRDNRDMIDAVYYLGGVNAVSQAVRDDISALLR